jgi:hypothetical protein
MFSGVQYVDEKQQAYNKNTIHVAQEEALDWLYF